MAAAERQRDALLSALPRSEVAMPARAGNAIPKAAASMLGLAPGAPPVRAPAGTGALAPLAPPARLSADNRIAAPTIIPYAVVGANTPAEARALVRQVKAKGAAG